MRRYEILLGVGPVILLVSAREAESQCKESVDLPDWAICSRGSSFMSASPRFLVGPTSVAEDNFYMIVRNKVAFPSQIEACLKIPRF